MGDGQLDHNILKLMLMFFFVEKIVDHSEQKIMNNKLLKIILENV